jgi:hypothetical protein
MAGFCVYTILGELGYGLKRIGLRQGDDGDCIPVVPYPELSFATIRFLISFFRRHDTTPIFL